MRSQKIQSTKDYRLFQRHGDENRPVDLGKHKKLVESMKLYGFLKSYPIVVYRGGNGILIVKDGQHRLTIAETLGLPIHYVEEEVDFDVAIVNSTAKVWTLRDYAAKFAANGISDYADGLGFASDHGLPIGRAFALLAGTTSFSNCQDEFISGKWRISDSRWANAVAAIYAPMVRINAAVRNDRFIEACMAVCRVEVFKAERLLRNAETRCREKLQAYSTRDAYLGMIEEIYNFGRKDLVGLKLAALMAMKSRCPVKKKAVEKPAAAA
jgi:hypothetical protein